MVIRSENKIKVTCLVNLFVFCLRRRTSSPDQFQWGGCGEAAYGARFARRFLDARELEADARSLMNLHNNRVGRKVSEVYSFLFLLYQMTERTSRMSDDD